MSAIIDERYSGRRMRMRMRQVALAEAAARRLTSAVVTSRRPARRRGMASAANAGRLVWLRVCGLFRIR